MVRIGMMILFIGVAFLLKFAYEHSHIPIELRLIGVSLGAILLLVLGWRARRSRTGYALTLQGGAVGLQYLTIFAAFRIYQVIEPGPAFVLLVLVAALSAILAVRQDSLALAAIGATGGFLAPILASTGQGSHIQLFSYYLVVNVGIVIVAWSKAWRVLNLIGFVFTFVVGLAWGARFYRPEFFPSTEPFLVAHFLLYVLLPILYAKRQDDAGSAYVDGTLVFGVPLAGFGLQACLVQHFQYGSALSALVVGAFYLVVTATLWRRADQRLRLLAEAFLALGSGFVTLVVPLAFDGRTTAAAWAIEGAALLWIGSRQARLLARVVGYLLQIGAGVAFLADSQLVVGATPVFNSVCLGCILIAFSAWFCSIYGARKSGPLGERAAVLATLMFIWGLIWWVGGGIHEIARFLDPDAKLHATLAYLGASALGLSIASRALIWPSARFAPYGFALVMSAVLGLDWANIDHPGARWGWLAWPGVLFAQMWMLRRHVEMPGSLQRILHPITFWIATAGLIWEVTWQATHIADLAPVWSIASWPLVPVALLWLIGSAPVRSRWPVADLPKTYLLTCSLPVLALLGAWILISNVTSDGNPAPLPYIPLLNPLDLAMLLVGLTASRWFVLIRRLGHVSIHGDDLGAVHVFAAATVFFWANALLLRSLHHWAGIPFEYFALYHSLLVQGTLSLSWSVTALVMMTLATHRVSRGLWIGGAILMGAVVVKLFLIDLAQIGSIERIVSFIGVGALMLILGYLAPVPPRADRLENDGSP